jgi:hypothetical protein
MALLRLLAVLLIPPLAVVALAVFAGGLVWGDRQRAEPPAAFVAWGERSFRTRRGFEMWLEATGLDYARWAKLHPHAAKRLSKRRKSAPSARVSAAAPSADSVRAPSWVGWALASLAVAAATLLAISRLPRIALPRVSLSAYGAGVVELLHRGGSSLPRHSPALPRPPPIAPLLRAVTTRAVAFAGRHPPAPTFAVATTALRRTRRHAGGAGAGTSRRALERWQRGRHGAGRAWSQAGRLARRAWVYAMRLVFDGLEDARDRLLYTKGLELLAFAGAGLVVALIVQVLAPRLLAP